MNVDVAAVLANDLAGRGYPFVLVGYWCISLLLNIGANLVAIPRWGAAGAASTSSLTYFVMFALVFRCFLSKSRSLWHRALFLEAQELQGLCRSLRRLLVLPDAR